MDMKPLSITYKAINHISQYKLTMSGSLTEPSIGTRKWEKLKNVPDLSDEPYDRLKI